MAERMKEKNLPKIRGTLMAPRLPVKIGATGGFVHWKIDKKRLEGWLKKEKNKKMKHIFKKNIQDAKQMGILG